MSSSKIWIVAKREYLTRVQKKTFILVTLLTPIGIALFSVLVGFIMSAGSKSDQRVLIHDDTGIIREMATNDKNFPYQFSENDLNTLKEEYRSMGYDILVHIPALKDSASTHISASYYGEEKPSLALLESIESHLGDQIQAYRMRKSKIEQSLLDSFLADIELENGAMDPNDHSGSAATGKLNIIIGTALGALMGFLMYLVIFIYGGMVMRSVMEEKLSRIVEVMVSSVRPIYLMMGKLIGVGGVGLTQLALWAILIPILLIIAQAFLPGMDHSQLASVSSVSQVDQESLNGFSGQQIIQAIFNIKWWLILPVFVLFFLGGYFIYSSMFAAMGSAINEDMGEGQQLMLPIIIVVLIAFYMLFPVLSNPNGTLAIFASMFPLFSPIIMPARLAFDPPWWQIVVSIVLMLSTVWFFIWLTSRIYRVGILMYGKKATIREMIKWLRYSE
ncbi:MAG: ABC transporter permease [Saprospiraceae bacterium]|uniref:ABC transporter permease n=1 Tax=Candidatus Opimibacter skivensis TaxID=2982028 RepID=A0A9D7SUP8_9BACT|nr:ABC transporter permease [Candidatus Opimibacter skivensis]